MMVWDHLDLIPLMVQAAENDFSLSALLDSHGGHSHALAYLILLSTTSLSSGWPFADVLSSWILLLVYSTLIAACLRSISGHADGRVYRRLLILGAIMTLSFLHLPNLIWGWQVAVFACLSGIALGLIAVTVKLNWFARFVLGGLGLLIAASSFATGIALFPALVAGVSLSHAISRKSKFTLVVSWLFLLILLLFFLNYLPHSSANEGVSVLGVLHYATNYIGGGVTRFARILSIPAVVLAVLISGFTFNHLARQSSKTIVLWAAMITFAGGAALLTAYGRYDPFGADQAFVIRYGSFASIFWFAVFGAYFSTNEETDLPRFVHYGMRSLLLMFAINSLHFIPQARDFHADAATLASGLAKTWPDVPETILSDLYFNQPSEALWRLQYLHDHNYPPFAD